MSEATTNQIMLAIGELRAEAKESQAQRAQLFTLVREQTALLQSLDRDVRVRLEQEGQRFAAIGKQVGELEPKVEALETERVHRRGVVSGLTMAAGAGGGAIALAARAVLKKVGLDVG